MGNKNSGARPRHGMTGTRFYIAWKNLRARCNNPIGRNSSYKGIGYDKRWDVFENFMDDMFDDYADNLEIDRRDPYLGYSKDNCRWVDETTQSANKRKKIKASSKYFGVSKHSCGKYQAEIRAYGVRHYGGIHIDEIDAAKAVNKMIEENNLPNRRNDV